LLAGEALPPNAWTHLAASYSRTTGEARLYVNGSPRAVQSIGTFILATANDVFIGGAANSTEFFHGLLDEVSVYNRALFADEIAALASHPAGKRPPVSNVPPKVNAGPDVAGKPANAAVALAGSVSDDGHPGYGVLSTRWSKVSGPGLVSFADDTKPQTTATFSEGGVYLLKLLADDGGFCSEDLVEVRAGPLFTFDTDSSLAAWWTANQTDLDAVSKLKLERFNGLGQREHALREGGGESDHQRRRLRRRLVDRVLGQAHLRWNAGRDDSALGRRRWTKRGAAGAAGQRRAKPDRAAEGFDWLRSPVRAGRHLRGQYVGSPRADL
jgi:hypothetical protein